MLHLSDKVLSIWLSAILLIFVYLFILFQVSNFENAWMQPEMTKIEPPYLKTGLSLVSKDFFNIWDWRINEENLSRPTRWVAWHADFLDTKFRAWLWQFFPPHPSLSLMWLCSLFFIPFLLIYYLRLQQISLSIALMGTAFYLMTPASLSGIFMLFRSSKILMTFFMLVTLVLVRLCELYPRKKLYFIGFCLAILLGLFSDETGFFIFPLIVCLHPHFVFRKGGWIGLLIVLFLGVIAYLWGIPFMSHYISGAPLMCLMKFQPISTDQLFRKFMDNIGPNAMALIGQTMGIVLPHAKASIFEKLLSLAGTLAWLILFIFMVLRKDFWQGSLKAVFPWLTLFLIAIGFHNLLMSMVNNQVWGPYYYGAYFPLIFSLALTFLLRRTSLGTVSRSLLIFIILCMMGNTFLYTNKIYKKYHYYPRKALVIRDIFSGQAKYFDPAIKTAFSDQQLKQYVDMAWKRPGEYRQWHLPRELYWLVVELNGFKKDYSSYYYKYEQPNKFYFATHIQPSHPLLTGIKK